MYKREIIYLRQTERNSDSHSKSETLPMCVFFFFTTIIYTYTQLVLYMLLMNEQPESYEDRLAKDLINSEAEK